MIAPDNPERAGYTFYGWTLELKEIPDIFVFNESTFFTENITLYAIWIINQYTIAFDTVGGSAVSSIIQNYGTAITAPSDPTRTGYTFYGWDTEIPATMPAGDLTVTATWGVNQYTITFDSTGGSSVSSIIQNYGTAITAPSDPTRTGYTFNGWDTEIPATMPAKDLTITAKWTINQYTITWKWMDENGAEIATTESLSYGATPNKTVEGYKTVSKVFTFKAWDSEIETVSGDKTYTATYDSVAREYIINWIVEGITVQTVEVPYGTVPEYTGVTPTKTATAEFTYTFYKWTPAAVAVTGNADYTAIFTEEINKYTITFDSAGGSAVNPITKNYNTDVTLPDLNSTTRTGHTFKGWSLTDNGEILTAHTLTEDVILYAVWEINHYTITFNSDGGSAVSSITQNYDTVIETPNNPTRTGYTFVKWDIDIPVMMPATDMTVTAVWMINQYIISFDENGADGTIPVTIIKKYGTSIDLPDVGNLIKIGHSFTGWAFDVDGDTVVYEAGATFNIPASNVRFIAVWTINQYTITFDTDGGSAVDSITKDYGTAISAPDNPIKEGYTFAGWYPIVPATMPAKNLTITALWTINQYTIELNPVDRFVIEDGDGFYTVKGSYTDNSTVEDVINEILGVSIYCNDADISDFFGISYYDMNGKEISVLDLSKGGTTFMIRLEATVNLDSNEHSSFGCWVIFKYGSVTIGNNEIYMTIEDALDQAESGDTIIVRYNTSFADEDVALQVYGKTVFEVGSGVTLLLPYDDTYSEKCTDYEKEITPLARNKAYIKLNVPDNIIINIEEGGAITVNAKRNLNAQPHQNFISGTNYSEIILNKGSKINVYGKLNVIGFAYGEGEIEAFSDATVQETMLNNGWRGGSATKEIYKKVFPIEQFSFINIECNFKINSGALYSVHLWVYVPTTDSKNESNIGIVGTGTDNMLNLTSGSITKKFNANYGEVTFELDGEAKLQDISLKAYGLSVSSKGLYLPLDGRWHFIIKQDSELNVETQVSLLPGSSLVIEEGATVNVNGSLVVFNPYEYACATEQFNKYPMSNTEKYYRVEPSFEYAYDTPAKLENFGTLNINENGKIAGRVTNLGTFVLDEDDKQEFEIKYITGSGSNAKAASRLVKLWTDEPYAISVTIVKSDKNADTVVTVLVKDIYGLGVSDKTVTFTYESSSKDADTDGNGYATVSFTAPYDSRVKVIIDGIEAEGIVSEPDESSCVAEGTLITLADGTQKSVEELTGDELLLVWNMNTGTFDVAPIIFIDSDPYAEYEIIHLYFSDGTDVKVIYEHGFWDFDLNRYVYINDDCPQQYVGHWFNKQTADADGNFAWTKVQLVDVVIHTEYTTAWSPVTAEHLCYYTNGMLSMPGGIAGLFNIFEIDPETMEIDQEAYLADIAEYGLFTYEEFLEILDVPEEIFDIFQAKYFKVAIGKGLLDADRLMELITRYGGILGVE